jgi:hypothetical protein
MSVEGDCPRRGPIKQRRPLLDGCSVHLDCVIVQPRWHPITQHHYNCLPLNHVSDVRSSMSFFHFGVRSRFVSDPSNSYIMRAFCGLGALRLVISDCATGLIRDFALVELRDIPCTHKL